MYLKTVFLYVLLAASLQIVTAQDNWQLKQNKEGIKVYTKNLENSPFKAIKTECTIDATLTAITAVLLDIPAGTDWVYATKKCVVLKQLSATEVYYYSEVNIPWPVSNRDFIVRIRVSQNDKTKAVTVAGDNFPAYLPVNKNIVRIPQSVSNWYIEPVGTSQVKVVYTLQVDPGGTVPAWLINLFAARGPFESFKNLRTQVKKAAYTQARLSFIKN